MSLLFDENLSRRLIRRLEVAYPQSEHLELVGLKGQADLEVWKYAQLSQGPSAQGDLAQRRKRRNGHHRGTAGGDSPVT